MSRQKESSKLRYRNFSGYLRETYHGKIRKICIDGGFTCPNRDGTCGTGGCIFCGDSGAGEHMPAAGRAVAEQVRSFFSYQPKGDGFIAYFQSFTNTYAPVDILKERYDAALTDERIIALAIGTRPDCITDEIAALLASYRPKYNVWVELGLQTASDRTAERINRGYKSEVFSKAAAILRAHGIPIVVHIMIGLPDETEADLADTVRFLRQFDLWGIKLHAVYVMKDTVLAQMYRQGQYVPLTAEEYVSRAVFVLTHIPPDIIVHRLTGDCRPDLLLAPAWNTDKDAVIAQINRRLAENNWTQGCFYAENE